MARQNRSARETPKPGRQQMGRQQMGRNPVPRAATVEKNRRCG